MLRLSAGFASQVRRVTASVTRSFTTSSLAGSTILLLRSHIASPATSYPPRLLPLPPAQARLKLNARCRSMSNAQAESKADETLDRVTDHQQYHTEGLDRADLNDNPLLQFHAWFKHARESGIKEPEAMTLATVNLAPSTSSPTGFIARPSSRVVLLKELDSRGFLFFTNYASRKSAELLANPYASLTFYWEPIHRSVRVVGRAEQLEPDRSDAYYASRPRGSQLGAWASPQSQTIGSRSELEERVAQVEREWDGKDTIQRPPFWGGWRIVPDEIEFWMGRESRLHDRFRCTRTEESGSWKVDRLGP